MFKINIITIGNKMPAWVETAYKDYTQRLKPHCKINLIEIPAIQRRNDNEIEKIKTLESEALLKAVPDNNLIIALDPRGKSWSTEQLASNLTQFRESGQDLSLLIGGPEGLTDDCRQKSAKLWSLSNLTFPHPMVRVILAEQLYRAWMINVGHPYHR